jgi:hypothetical protein
MQLTAERLQRHPHARPQAARRAFALPAANSGVRFANWGSNDGISPHSALPFAARSARSPFRARIRPPINMVFTLFAHHAAFGAPSPFYVAIRLPATVSHQGLRPDQ